MSAEPKRDGSGPPVLASHWYAEMVGEPLRSLDHELNASYPRLSRIAGRMPALRGLLAFRLAARAAGVAVIDGERGVATLLWCEAWLRRRRAVVLLELIPRRPDRRLRRAALDLWARVVLHPAMRRSVAVAQVLTERERELYAAELGMPIDRLVYVRWPLSVGGVEPAPAQGREGVLASGRAWTDWATLFAAARGREWPLTVAYGERYREVIPRLDRAGRARHLHEVPLAEHDRLLREAAVYVLPLRTDSPSAGHVRLMAATDAGTPVIATRVDALEGYVEDGVSAVVVPPDDPEALGAAIDLLLADPARRERLARSARERARAWTYAAYFSAIRHLVVSAVSPT